jgi:CheY-like chemotaxis protein
MNDHRHRMLLVEDDLQTRTLLRRILALCGWEVVEAATVAEGLARLATPPDCLLLDLELPDGDGESILRRVRADGLAVRVVVNTGTDDPDRLGAVSALNPDAVLKKPLDSDGLRTICERGRRAACQGDASLCPGNVRPPSPDDGRTPPRPRYPR